MKKIGIVTGIVFAIIIIGLLLVHIQEREFDVTKEQTTVGLVLNNPVDDRSWAQAHYEGIEKNAERLNLRVLYRESVAEGAECVDAMEELIGEGCKIIICSSFGYGDSIMEVAGRHPEIYFFYATGLTRAKNVTSYYGRIYQMRYLSGIVAGLQTQTNQIGYVGSQNIPEVNRGINAFTLGVRAVNPDAKVYVTFSNTWTDDEITRAAAKRLFDAYDIDVATMHTDSLAVLEEADARGIYSIGYNYDNADKYPDTFLTAPVWNWGIFYSARILECIQGKLHGESYWEGIESGIIGLSPLTKNVKAGTAEKVEEARKALEDGSFDVFYGPICDNEGNFRVLEGENMSDAVLLNALDWYVMGVELYEE